MKNYNFCWPTQYCDLGTNRYPTCRCKVFSVGNAQFKPANPTVDVRAGETHTFSCPSGFYVDGDPDLATYFNATCLPDGAFEQTAKTCALIPCTQADINRGGSAR